MPKAEPNDSRAAGTLQPNFSIPCQFTPGQKVRIIDLDGNPARVIGYKLEGKNLFVEVCYWVDGKYYELYLEEYEVEAAK